MSDQALACCEAARTCSEIRWLKGDDIEPRQDAAAFTIITDIRPDSPRGVDLYRSAIAFCPFCGAKIEGYR